MLYTGLDVLLTENLTLTQGRRVGLVTHAAAVLPDLTHAIEALRTAGVELVALFGPEHGLEGSAAEGAHVADSAGSRGGIPVFSLYGETLEPTPEMLAGIDLLLFDMQDVGVRFYTYLSTLSYVLRVAARSGIPLVVLDRPNPLGGAHVEGPLIAPGYESFVGIAPLPIRHGLTFGEAARWLDAHFRLGADLTVVSMQGWRRADWFSDTGRLWLPTSPALAHLAAVTLYPGTCLIEGTNLSVGRGTALPFEVCGAPWLDGQALAATLNASGLPGVRFRPLRFTPAGNTFAGVECGGVQLHVTDRDALQSVAVGLELVAAVRAQHPDSLAWQTTHFDRLIGGSNVRTALESGTTATEIIAGWAAPAQQFLAERREFLLYD